MTPEQRLAYHTRLQGTLVTEPPKPSGRLTPMQHIVYNEVAKRLIQLKMLSEEDVYALEELAVVIHASRQARQVWNKHGNFTVTQYTAQGNERVVKHPDWEVLQNVQMQLAKMLATLGLTPRSRQLMRGFGDRMPLLPDDPEGDGADPRTGDDPDNPFSSLPGVDDE